MLPLTVVDNFFESPSYIRNYALQQSFDKFGVHPGIRTKKLSEINENMNKFISDKIISLFFDLRKDRVYCNIDASFQITSEHYEEGWVHNDDGGQDGPDFAGVVYLTPNAPLDTGTSIHSPNEKYNGLDHKLKDLFYADKEVDIEMYRTAREENNSKFYKTLDISNVYNRLVVYNAQDFHKENKFFGNTNNTSRMTMVFFGKFINNISTGIVRSRTISSY